MTWLTPLIAGVGAAVLIPSLVVLYFLKLRRRDVEVSTTLLWKKTIQDMQANAPFQKLRRNLLFFLQLLILLAGLFAVAQPEFRSEASPPPRSVIIIDRSASMAAEDAIDEDGRTISRLDLAKREALKLVDLMDSGGTFKRSSAPEAMVIAFDRNASVVQPFTRNKGRLRTAIESIAPTDAVTSIEEAIRLANAQAAPIENVGIKGVPIYLWSDGDIPDLAEVDLLADTPFEYMKMGDGDRPNVGVVALEAERAYDDPEQATIFVGLQSTDPEPRDVFVEVAVNGVRSGAGTVSIPAADNMGPGTASFVLPLARRDGAAIVASVDVDDALGADDTARLVLPPAKQLSVAFVTEGNFFLKYALESLQLSRVEQMTPARFQRLAERDELGGFDVVILDSWVPVTAGAAPTDDENATETEEASLPPGQYLIFNAIPKMRGVLAAPELEDDAPSQVIDWRRDHPALRNVTMANLLMWEPAPLEATDEAVVLADAELGPAVVEATQGAVRAIICGFDISDTTWYLEPSWVLFLASSIRYLGDGLGGESIDAARPGGALVTRLPSDAEDVELLLPDGERVTLHPSEDGRVHFGPINDSGFYRIQWRGSVGAGDVRSGGRVERVIPVNVLDARESRIATLEEIMLPTGEVEAAAGEARNRYATTRLWPWLLAAALAVLMFEWFIYNRRVYL